MRVLMIGASGVGKGTQALKLAKYFNIEHVSTGDLLREEVKYNSALSRAVGKLIDRGYLLPDELMLSIAEEIIEKDNIILDGFPRTIFQARALDNMCNELNSPIDIAVHIHIPDDIILERVTGRYVCEGCGRMYHISYYQPKQQGVCDDCNSRLIQRVDDTDSTVRNRLRIYHEQTEPIINHYYKQGLLVSVSGLGDVDEVFEVILSLMNKRLEANRKDVDNN